MNQLFVYMGNLLELAEMNDYCQTLTMELGFKFLPLRQIESVFSRDHEEKAKQEA
jgi:hypothetical protein